MATHFPSSLTCQNANWLSLSLVYIDNNDAVIQIEDDTIKITHIFNFPFVLIFNILRSHQILKYCSFATSVLHVVVTIALVLVEKVAVIVVFIVVIVVVASEVVIQENAVR